jgi:MoxR-like ATPase
VIPELEPFYAAVESVLVGQRPLIDRLLIALLCEGHVLLEGVPGLAKTLTVRTVATASGLSFRRVQFTPDLLPADVVGTPVYNPRTGEFSTKRGPIFAQVVLADEINRAPAKVQSALLEAMQERQVTIGEETFPLPRPFFVLATQNPIEQEGTYPLPEAQVDRFLMKLIVGYPSRADELAILERMGGGEEPHIDAVWTADELPRLRTMLNSIYVDAKIHGYVVDLVRATRHPAEYGLDIAGLIQFGASPRATLALAKAAKGHALLSGKNYVSPENVKAVATDVLRHRVLLSFEAEAEELTSDVVVKKILDGVAVP